MIRRDCFALFLLCLAPYAIADSVPGGHGPSGEPAPSSPTAVVDEFDRLTREIEALSAEISVHSKNQPTIREPSKFDIRQQPPDSRKTLVEGRKNHLAILKVIRKIVGDGKLPPGVLHSIEIANYPPGREVDSDVSEQRSLRLSASATEAEVRRIFAKLPSKEELDAMQSEIAELERKLSRATIGLNVSAMGGQIKSMKAARDGLRTVEKLLPHLDLDPKVITNISVVSSKTHAVYSDFMKSFPVWPGETVEEAKKVLEAVPFAPTAGTYAEIEKMIASTKDPLIQQTLRKGAQEMKKLEVADARKLTRLGLQAADHLGVESLDVFQLGPKAGEFLERLLKIDRSKIKPGRAVKRILFGGKESAELDYGGRLGVPANATDETIIALINATPDKKAFEKESALVKRRLEEAGRKMGPGGFIALDYSRVTNAEALAAAQAIEDLAAKGYELTPPGKGFWVVSHATPGWAGARYFDDRKQLIMFGAKATEKELLEGGFIRKKGAEGITMPESGRGYTVDELKKMGIKPPPPIVADEPETPKMPATAPPPSQPSREPAAVVTSWQAAGGRVDVNGVPFIAFGEAHPPLVPGQVYNLGSRSYWRYTGSQWVKP